jgi:alpha-D-ribose 1-methylphosphonate 5-triphosphate synthase subunit PhnG
MRMGNDRPGALAAAICDAEVEANGREAGDVIALCEATERSDRAARSAEWQQLKATVVRFEEMGE